MRRRPRELTALLIALRSPKPGERRPLGQGGKPTGWFGRVVLWRMNLSHSEVTDWGLGHVTVGPRDFVLDVGCGGGRTVAKLAARTTEGRVCGVDHSATSVAASLRVNRRSIAEGRVAIHLASVSALPYAEATFDLVTAVETHFWWPDPLQDLREVWRVLKPGGRALLIAEFYKGGRHAKYADRLSALTGIAALTPDEHRELMTKAGFIDTEVTEEARRGRLCVLAWRPA